MILGLLVFAVLNRYLGISRFFCSVRSVGVGTASPMSVIGLIVIGGVPPVPIGLETPI